MKASFNANQPALDRVNSKTESLWNKSLSLFNNLLKSAIDFLSVNTEIRVRKTVDSRGNTYWHVYDPMTEQRNRFESEKEVRVWIEERYYR